MVTRRLKCRLTDDEILERGQQLANAEHAWQKTEEERKETNAEFKESLDTIDARIAALTKAIRDRVEERDVECEVRPDYRVGKNLVIRIDTEETVEALDMTEAERQMELLPGAREVSR